MAKSLTMTGAKSVGSRYVVEFNGKRNIEFKSLAEAQEYGDQSKIDNAMLQIMTQIFVAARLHFGAGVLGKTLTFDLTDVNGNILKLS